MLINVIMGVQPLSMLSEVCNSLLIIAGVYKNPCQCYHVCTITYTGMADYFYQSIKGGQ